MTIEDWKAELFYLFQCCKGNPHLWPKNLEDAIEWQDDDAKEYLKELWELDKKGAFKFNEKKNP